MQLLRHLDMITAIPLELVVGSGAIQRFCKVMERRVTMRVLVCHGGRCAYTTLILNAPPLDSTNWALGE